MADGKEEREQKKAALAAEKAKKGSADWPHSQSEEDEMANSDADNRS